VLPNTRELAGAHAKFSQYGLAPRGSFDLTRDAHGQIVAERSGYLDDHGTAALGNEFPAKARRRRAARVQDDGQFGVQAFPDALACVTRHECKLSAVFEF